MRLKTRLTVLAFGALLTLALAQMTQPKAPAAAKKSSDVILRDNLDGSWDIFIFAPICPGKIEAKKGEDLGDPLKVSCRK